MPDVGRYTQQKPTPMTFEDVNLVYDANALTPAWADRVDEGGSGVAFAEALAQVLISWDLTEGGAEFPPTAENLARLPLIFLTEMFMELPTHAAEAVRAEGKSLDASPRSEGGSPPGSDPANGGIALEQPASTASAPVS